MTRNDFHTRRQRCSDNGKNLSSSHGNVAKLMNDTNIIHIFAARILKQ